MRYGFDIQEGRPEEAPPELTDELRRQFELEGEGALILRMELPQGDPWRPDPVERRAAIAWILEKNRARRRQDTGTVVSTRMSRVVGNPFWLVAIGAVIGLVIGVALGYLFGVLWFES